MSLSGFTYYYRLPPSATLVELTEVKINDLAFNVSKDSIRYEVELGSEIIAVGSSYTALKALLDSDPCDQVEFVIQYNASEVWSGQLNLKKGTWNPLLCTVRFTPDVKNDDYCLKENWEEENNMFSYGSEVIAETFFGTLTEVTCGPVNQSTPIQINGFFELNVNGCLADVSAYAGIRFYIEEITPGSSYDHYATWVTEQAVVACSGGVPVSPPGDGWVLLNNDCGGSGNATWGRKPQVTYMGEVSGTSGKYWDNTYSVVGSDASTYGNGRLFSDIIAGLTAGCSYTVKSDFFGINADATAPSNSAYTASSAVQDIIVYQKSDIKNPDASNPATIRNLTLKDLLEWLEQMFAVVWQIQDSGATLRLEHISYFAGSNGDDLTSLHPTYVANKNTFTYETGNLVPREKFEWMDETTDADFKGLDIIYPSGCADASREAEVIRVNGVFTDLGTVNSSPENVQDEGFFFMAVDEISGTYYMNRETGEISGEIKPNAHLAWANLQENYLSWNRQQSSGTMNNVSTSFNDYIKAKKQESIFYPLSVTDFFNKDFSEKLNTEIGWGEVASASYSSKSCLLTVELLHED